MDQWASLSCRNYPVWLPEWNAMERGGGGSKVSENAIIDNNRRRGPNWSGRGGGWRMCGSRNARSE